MGMRAIKILKSAMKNKDASENEKYEKISKEYQLIEEVFKNLKVNVVDGGCAVITPSYVKYYFKALSQTAYKKALKVESDITMHLGGYNQVRVYGDTYGLEIYVEVSSNNYDEITLNDALSLLEGHNDGLYFTVGVGEEEVVYNLANAPHLLVGGATGTGKSCFLTNMVLNLALTKTPEELNFVFVDPKIVEFSIFGGLPHLKTPIINETEQFVSFIEKLYEEMEARYEKLSQSECRNIQSYNEKAKKEGGEIMPYKVVVIDELADLFYGNKKKMENLLVPILQKSRAAGIHFVISTQRLSTDVLTSSIFANVPARAALKTASYIDSKLILGSKDAIYLRGAGDLIFKNPAKTKMERCQVPYVGVPEILSVIGDLMKKYS